VQGLLHTTCRELVELLDGTACAISRVVGDLLVGLEEFTRTRRPLEHGHEFLISDFPLTQEVVERGEPRSLSRRDPAAEAKEAELLEQLGFESLLMVCLPAGASAGVLSRSTARAARSTSAARSSRSGSPPTRATGSRSSSAAGDS
jgi:hypothetical protein